MIAAGAGMERELEAAVHREVVLGDLNGAMQQYGSILESQEKTRPVAARALLQMGRCLEKSGRRVEARNAYARVAREYGDQPEIAALARARLAKWDEPLPGPRNLKFEEGVPGKVPPGWFVPALPKDADHWAELRRSGCRSAIGCAVVLVPDNAPAHWGEMMQGFNAAPYRGKTVRLRAWLRLESADPGDSAQMWMSVDRANDRKGFFDNMSDRPIHSAEWTRCDIATRVDEDATFIQLGVMSIGKGRVWVDGVSFETQP